MVYYKSLLTVSNKIDKPVWASWTALLFYTSRVIPPATNDIIIQIHGFVSYVLRKFFGLGLKWTHLTERRITTNTEEHIFLHLNLYLKAKKACTVAFCYLLACAEQVKVYPFISLSVRISFSSGAQFLYNAFKHVKCIVAVVRSEQWDQWYSYQIRIRILCFVSKSTLIGI